MSDVKKGDRHSNRSRHTMKYVALILCWQFGVYCLIVGGIFVSFHGILGVDWNSTNFVDNTLVTLFGLVVLEGPLVLIVSSMRKEDKEEQASERE